MADKNAVWPDGTQLAKPDGSLYVYLQASEDLEPGMYVDLNANQRIMKFKGLGLRFPPGITVETCPKEFYTFIMVKGPTQTAPVVG